MKLANIQDLMRNQIQKNNDNIRINLSSNVALINQISNYIIHSGGKRLRPLIVLLLSRALNYQGNSDINLASIIEFIHTATLLHDDVVDSSELRRGKKTANNVFGNSASILTGDFLYSRAFQLMVELKSMPIMNILADATNKIAEGEVLQLLNCNNPSTTENDYMNVIYCKTAKLFEALCEASGVLSQLSLDKLAQLKKYGKHLGNAFQLADDIMDFLSDSETMGKNVGDDIAEGKPTLPIIHAIQKTDPENKEILIKAIKEGSISEIKKIIEIIKSTNSISYTQEIALQEANKAKLALKFIPESEYKSALLTLCDISVQRLT